MAQIAITYCVEAGEPPKMTVLRGDEVGYIYDMVGGHGQSSGRPFAVRVWANTTGGARQTFVVPIALMKNILKEE